MDILILHDEVGPDARSDETDVLQQRDAVREALLRVGHRVRSAPVGLDLAALAARLGDDPPELVFNLVETIARSGRLIHVLPALLDTLGVRYSGSGTDAIYTTSNKRLAKRLLTAAGLPTPEATTRDQLRAARRFTPGRYLVKSNLEHGSLGIGPDSAAGPMYNRDGSVRRSWYDPVGWAGASSPANGSCI